MKRLLPPTTRYRLSLLACVLLACALTLAACDSATPVTQTEPPAAVLAPLAHSQARVEVCHQRGPNGYQLIEVAAPAVEAHRAHGDAAPGEAVPGMEGYVFDEACQPVLAATCPCFDAADLEAKGPVQSCTIEDNSSFVIFSNDFACAGSNCSGGANSCAFGSLGFPEVERSDLMPAETQACRALIIARCDAAGL